MTGKTLTNSTNNSTDAEMDAFRDSARDFLSRTDQLSRLRALRGTRPGFERAVWREMAGLGWQAILVPEEYGGLGLGLREVVAITEEIGQRLLPEPFIAAAVQPAAALCHMPDTDLRASLLGQLADGSVIIGLAWQEQLGELDVNQLATTAEPDGDTLLLNGRKRFVIPANGADGWIVSVLVGGVSGDEFKLVWVPATTPGISVSDMQRVDGNVMCDIVLEQVRVPANHVLASGLIAQTALEIANDTARIAQGAELIGVMRHTMLLTLDYLNTRKQFGKAIGSFQVLKHRAVDAYVQMELASACLAEALTLIDSGTTPLSILASRVKARCAHAALIVTKMAIQFHGAMGFTDECDIGLYFKHAMHLSAWLGNAAVSRQRHFVQQPRITATKSTSTTLDIPRDADWEQMPELEFRQLVRSFYTQNYPQELRNLPWRPHWHEIKDWYFTLSRQGWVAPGWPKKFGGMGLPPDKLLALVEEQEQYGVARAPDMGIVMIGPLLIQRGSPEQQRRFLPKILSGDNIWCQGYSEPGAGSDLAALRTEAILDGDEFIVTGHKI